VFECFKGSLVCSGLLVTLYGVGVVLLGIQLLVSRNVWLGIG
jgi:Na+-transporting methylmalonyl-CoA/oxaloacetate decarboxylase gamma subunit